MYYTNTVWRGLIRVLDQCFWGYWESISHCYPLVCLMRATSKTLMIGAEEVRWLRLLLHQHSSAGSVMYGSR